MAELKTPVFNWEKLDFSYNSQGVVETATGSAALLQIVLKAEQTARGIYLIYANPDNLEIHHKYGNDAQVILEDRKISEEVRISELQRVTREALIYDPWIKDVSAVEVKQEAGEDGVLNWYVAFTITSIWDEQKQVEGVLING